MWLFKSFVQGVYTLCSGTHLGDHFAIHSASPVSEQGCSSFSKYDIAFSALDLGSLFLVHKEYLLLQIEVPAPQIPAKRSILT